MSIFGSTESWLVSDRFLSFWPLALNFVDSSLNARVLVLIQAVVVFVGSGIRMGMVISSRY